MDSVTGKTAIIYGGGRTLGAAVAATFAREAESVVLDALDEAADDTRLRRTSSPPVRLPGRWPRRGPASSGILTARPAPVSHPGWAAPVRRTPRSSRSCVISPRRPSVPGIRVCGLWTAGVAEVAAFLASDRAGGLTGSMTNVTCGLVLH